MACLIVGGSSGLGLLLAELVSKNEKVIITGRTAPKVDFAEFRQLDLAQTDLATRIEAFVADLPEIRTLIYAAGYYQEGRITDLTPAQIEEMLDVGGRGLIYVVRAVLAKQDKLDELVTITSSSQWTARQLEPMYNFVKAAEAHFSSSIAEDGRVGKVLVAGPQGMDTPFWRNYPDRDTSEMLDPKWVADEIMKLLNDTYHYRFAQILRAPARVEVVESR